MSLCVACGVVVTDFAGKRERGAGSLQSESWGDVEMSLWEFAVLDVTDKGVGKLGQM